MYHNNPVLELDDESLAELGLARRILAARGEGVEAVKAFGKHVFFVDCPAHVEAWLVEFFENPDNLAIQAPPESAKTTWMGVILPAWWVGKYPHLTNMIVSVTDDQAGKSVNLISDTIERSEKWKEVFPGVVPDKDKGWSREGYYVKDTADPQWEKKVATRKDPSLVAGGVGSGLVIGKRVTGLLVCDDLHDEKSMSSQATREMTVNFFQTTIFSRLTAGARMLVIGTPWHPADVFKHIRATGLFRVFSLPAETGAGEERASYWPAEFPLARLDKIERGLTSAKYKLMYLMDAKGAEGHVLKLESLRTFPTVRIQKEFDRYFGVDFTMKMDEITGKAGRDPDYFALAVWVNAYDAVVLEDGVRERVYLSEAEDLFFQWADLWNPVNSVIETERAGAVYFMNLIRRMNVRGGRRHVLRHTTPVKNKTLRVAELEPYFKTGQYRLADEETPFLKAFREEWAGFGARGSHDDTLDAAYNGHLAVVNLLPAQSREQAEQAAAEPAYRSPFARLEAAYRRL